MIKRTMEEMVSRFNQIVSKMDIPQSNKLGILGMVTALYQKYDEDVQHWILCGERLPDEDFHTGLGRQFSDYVLVTVINHANDNERFVDVAYTQDGTWRMAHADDGDCEVPYWCEIVAWRSLPKPFMEDHDGCMDV